MIPEQSFSFEEAPELIERIKSSFRFQESLKLKT